MGPEHEAYEDIATSPERTARLGLAPHEHPLRERRLEMDQQQLWTSANVAYQVTDLTLCPVPKGSSIVTAIVRCCDLKLSLNPMALDYKLLGGEGKVIRMTQLSPDSWMLLGYRYDDSVSGPRTRGSLTLLNTGRMSNPHSDAASHDTDHPDDDGDEEDENGAKDTGEYRPYAVGNN
ncbi:hypothetical protein V2W45_1326133 [Cenococcum geophilum]